MTRKVSQETLEEVYTGLQLCLMQKPGGCGATDVWRELFKDKWSRSHVDNAFFMLRKSGHIKFVGSVGSSHRYVLTDKEFAFRVPVMALNGGTPLFTPDNPAEPGGWITDLNKVIAGLELLQAAIPGLKVGLLDLTKNLERLAKVKEIIGDVAKAARRNV